MKVIIAGSRHFEDYYFVSKRLDRILVDIATPIEIVSGGQKGVDKLGERYANEKGFKLTVMEADWEKYGNSAGPIRNQKMAKYAEGLIVFDAGGTGSRDMIEKATRAGLDIRRIQISLNGGTVCDKLSMYDPSKWKQNG